MFHMWICAVGYCLLLNAQCVLCKHTAVIIKNHYFAPIKNLLFLSIDYLGRGKETHLVLLMKTDNLIEKLT